METIHKNCILWIHLKLIMVPYFSEFATKTLVVELNEVVFSKRPTYYGLRVNGHESKCAIPVSVSKLSYREL